MEKTNNQTSTEKRPRATANTRKKAVPKSKAQTFERQIAETDNNPGTGLNVLPEETKISDKNTFTEILPMEFVSDVTVKEESMDDECYLNFYKTTEAETKTKCGEIFIGSNDDCFTFVCTQCLKNFRDLLSFGEHIKDSHTLKKDEICETVLQADSVVLIKNEPLNFFPNTPEPIDDDNADGRYTLTEGEFCKEEENETGSDFNSQPSNRESNKKPTSGKRKKEKKLSQLVCLSCCMVTARFVTYQNHYRTEHPDMIAKDDNTDNAIAPDPAKFVPKIPDEMICKYCLQKFKDSDAFVHHITSEHLVFKVFSCHLCPKTFTSRSPRDAHVNAHLGLRPHQCPHCPHRFAHPNNLRTHIKIHLNIKAYTCEYCSKKFVSLSDLRIHRRTHTKEKPFQCDECGMAFIAQVQLTNHKRIKHLNIKRHKCSYCEAAFYRSTELKRHIRTHTLERPFSCNVCEKTFRAKAALRSHRLLHSDEKKYACKLCDKMFTQHAGLYSHMKSHREIKKC